MTLVCACYHNNKAYFFSDALLSSPNSAGDFTAIPGHLNLRGKTFPDGMSLSLGMKTEIIFDNIIIQWAGSWLHAKILLMRLKKYADPKKPARVIKIVNKFISDHEGKPVDLSLILFYSYNGKLFRTHLNCKEIRFQDGFIIVGGSGEYKFIDENTVLGTLDEEPPFQSALDFFRDRINRTLISSFWDQDHYLHHFGAAYEFAVGDSETGFKKLEFFSGIATFKKKLGALTADQQYTYYDNGHLFIETSTRFDPKNRRVDCILSSRSPRPKTEYIRMVVDEKMVNPSVAFFSLYNQKLKTPSITCLTHFELDGDIIRFGPKYDSKVRLSNRLAHELRLASGHPVFAESHLDL